MCACERAHIHPRSLFVQVQPQIRYGSLSLNRFILLNTHLKIFFSYSQHKRYRLLKQIVCLFALQMCFLSNFPLKWYKMRVVMAVNYVRWVFIHTWVNDLDGCPFKSSEKRQQEHLFAGTLREIDYRRKGLWEISERHNYLSLDANKTRK